MTVVTVVDSATGQRVPPKSNATAVRLASSFDDFLERSGERLNPILVKEARQALKSRQFVVTFSLLLLAAWVWSLVGVSMLTPGVYYAPSGPFLLIGYFLILAVPLLVIVPFSAFWSLAREREDQTFELVSITALSAPQIIHGKLGSAIVQMLVYYSALAPCIAFTYLLRGIDVLVVAILLGGTFVVSVLFSVVGLAMAALTQTRHWQLLVAVVLLFALGWGSFFWVTIVLQLLWQSSAANVSEFWIGALAMISGAASYHVLLARVAAAQLSFASDNRATPVRRAMLAQLVLFVGWMAYAFFTHSVDDILYITLIVAAIHWAVYGVLMNGETAELSPRAKRRLPHSLLGRSFCTWFNPGAETGYIFSVATFSSVILVVLGWDYWTWKFHKTTAGPELSFFAVVLWGYFVFYLGLGRSLVALLGKFLQTSFFVSLVVHAVMLLTASLVPTFVQSWLEGFSGLSYSPLQLPNWFWTLVEAADGNLTIEPVIIVSAAIVVLILHLLRAADEVRHVRTLVPQRVQEDDRGDIPSPPVPGVP